MRLVLQQAVLRYSLGLHHVVQQSKEGLIDFDKVWIPNGYFVNLAKAVVIADVAHD